MYIQYMVGQFSNIKCLLTSLPEIIKSDLFEQDLYHILSFFHNLSTSKSNQFR